MDPWPALIMWEIAARQSQNGAVALTRNIEGGVTRRVTRHRVVHQDGHRTERLDRLCDEVIARAFAVQVRLHECRLAARVQDLFRHVLAALAVAAVDHHPRPLPAELERDRLADPKGRGTGDHGNLAAQPAAGRTVRPFVCSHESGD